VDSRGCGAEGHLCLSAVIFINLTTSQGCVIQPKVLVAKGLGASIRVNRISIPVVLHLELQTCQIFLRFKVTLKYRVRINYRSILQNHIFTNAKQKYMMMTLPTQVMA
jgi:hypothetical protein